MASCVMRILYLPHALTPARCGARSGLKTRPSSPADVQVSHSQAVSASAVDGHSVSGLASPFSANGSWLYGQEVRSVPPWRIRSKTTRWAGQARGRRGAGTVTAGEALRARERSRTRPSA
jgi:hypothetical protein